jgi:hypothetical protein
MKQTLPLLLALLAAFGLATPARAALTNPKHEDIDYIMEHVPESGQDARILTLPWPGAPLEAGQWQATIEPGYMDNKGSLFTISGPMFAGGATYALSDRLGISGMAFYDSFSIGGGNGREVLHPQFAGIPLDLPENAEFFDPGGKSVQWGAGGGIVWQQPRSGDAPYRTYMAGLLYHKLDVTGFAVRWRLVGGNDAGKTGTLDHSGADSYVMPYLGLQQTRNLGRSFTIAPRVIAAAPLPKGKFYSRFTGPGFDVSSDTGAIGDPFVGLGMEIQHRPTGLALDLGGTAYFAVAEGIVHKGVSQAWTLHLAWHPPTRTAP